MYEKAKLKNALRQGSDKSNTTLDLPSVQHQNPIIFRQAIFFPILQRIPL